MDKAAVKSWSLHSAFVQANLVAGYRYLDLAGRLLNKFSPRYKQVQEVSLGGTLLVDPIDGSLPHELSFNSSRIWLHYVSMKSLTGLETISPVLIREIASGIEVKAFDRVGLRVVHHVPAKDVLEATYQITSKMLTGPLRAYLTKSPREDFPLNMTLPFAYNNKEVLLRLRWIKISHPASAPGDFPAAGVLLDIDAGKRAKSVPLKMGDIAPAIAELKQAAIDLASDTGPKLIEGVTL